MIEIITEDMSTASAVDMNVTGKPKKKRKCETFNVSDDCFHKLDMEKQSLNDGQSIWI